MTGSRGKEENVDGNEIYGERREGCAMEEMWDCSVETYDYEHYLSHQLRQDKCSGPERGKVHKEKHYREFNVEHVMTWRDEQWELNGNTRTSSL